MTLPADFKFSQGSLQDYVDCPRRFELRYLRRLRWPAIETEPAVENERHLRLGAAFHRLIRQHLTGIPVDKLSSTVTHAGLRRWWHTYLESGPADLPSQRYPEVSLTASARGYRLVARYDLIAVDPGERVLVVDWKTNRNRPPRAWSARRLQTRVYPYVLVQAGHVLNAGMPIHPNRVAMTYWFANSAAEPERFTYNASQYRADGEYLTALVKTIEDSVTAHADGGLLPPTTRDGRRCRFCRYRSLCERGIESGWLDQGAQWSMGEETPDFSVDFEQIAELDAA